MRRFSIASFVLLLASVPVVAQHGGGHASAGGRSGMASHASFGGHSATSVHSGSSFSSRPAQRAPAFRGQTFRGPAFRQPLSPGFNRFRGPRIRNFRNCFGCRRSIGSYAGYYDPWWWWNSDSSYDQDREREMELAVEMNQQSLDEQQMRQQGDDDSYSYSASSYSASTAPRNQSISAEPAAPATVLIFRDQHRQEVQNYAIVGTTLWSFAPQRTQKIQLADLDIQATEKANDDRGVEFKVPMESPGQ